MARGNISSLTEKQLEQIVAGKKAYTSQQTKRELRTLSKNSSLDDIIDYLITQQKDFKKQGILK